MALRPLYHSGKWSLDYEVPRALNANERTGQETSRPPNRVLDMPLVTPIDNWAIEGAPSPLDSKRRSRDAPISPSRRLWVASGSRQNWGHPDGSEPEVEPPCKIPPLPPNEVRNCEKL